MATTDAGDSRYEAFRTLAAELQVRRAGVHGARMAERLLAAADGRDLVGVGPDAERALYHELASRSLVAVRFDKHGVDTASRELLRRGLDDPTAWVAAYGDGLAWVHPRYVE
ncbi:hypothetical protein [Haloparvum sedimenti]|uniref:hypothetical protein n=1 Tax=Haloparvum sedimenti TaxID=1678448 RepID=UPI001FE1C838|nr:hypothetical protein [Haloparvum sedimenti]